MGSIGLLIGDLHRSGIRRKPRTGRDAATAPPTHFMVGPLAHILKNRFYIGEVVYRGEVHPGAEQPIVDRDLFEAVQAKLKDKAIVRRGHRSSSSSFLSGLLFDDGGHAMSPSHANKKGVRYRYYVSQAVLQNRGSDAGSIARVAAPDVEELVVAAIRQEIASRANQDAGRTPSSSQLSDRDLVALHVRRIVLRARRVEVTLEAGASTPSEEGAAALPSAQAEDAVSASMVLQLPWTPMSARCRKGLAWQPSAHATLDTNASDDLLAAIARARRWMGDLAEGRVDSFAQIARNVNKVERHVRFLAPLAFLSPRIIEAIVDGSAPANLTITALARALPHTWAEQEREFATTR